jgi:S1-C subfamily serine protease
MKIAIALATTLAPMMAMAAGPTRKAAYADVLAACRIQPGDVQAAPHVVEGTIKGFRYTIVRPGSAYARAGFKVGDVLIEQNGVKMTSPDDVITAFESIALGEPQVSKVQRGDKVITFKMKCPRKK